MLNRCGVDSVTCAALAYDAVNGTDCERQLAAVLKSGECFSMKHLAVSGDDLLALGYRGTELGEMMRFLLDYVMEYPENNRRELLLALAKDSEES
jgi:tRNA nucleotidyltransferase (CCA-adding enzyme)